MRVIAGREKRAVSRGYGGFENVRLGTEALRTTRLAGPLVPAGGLPAFADLSLDDLPDLGGGQAAPGDFASAQAGSCAGQVLAAGAGRRRRGGHGLGVADRTQRRAQCRHGDAVLAPQGLPERRPQPALGDGAGIIVPAGTVHAGNLWAGGWNADLNPG
jgi:hypothetical protein